MNLTVPSRLHVTEAAHSELQVLIDQNNALVADIHALDMRILGIGRTPKHLRFQRLAEFQLERAIRIREHKQLVYQIKAIAPHAQPEPSTSS